MEERLIKKGFKRIEKRVQVKRSIVIIEIRLKLIQLSTVSLTGRVDSYDKLRNDYRILYLYGILTYPSPLILNLTLHIYTNITSLYRFYVIFSVLPFFFPIFGKKKEKILN